MAERTGNYTEAENSKSKRNWWLFAGVLTSLVSVPVGLLCLGVAGYQHIKSKEKK